MESKFWTMFFATIIVLILLLISTKATAEEAKIVLTEGNTLTLNDAVYRDYTSKIEQKSRELDARLKSSEPLFLVLDTPGGTIQAGLELIQNLSTLNRPVHTITIFSASMGFHTVQGLGQRYVLKYGTLMTHKASGGFYGEFPGQIDSRYSYYLRRLNRMDNQVVYRTRGKHTLQSYKNLYENEYWCDGSDCITQGFADKVVVASCDKSLAGTHEEVWWKTVYRGKTIEIVVTKADCPLTTGWLDYKILIDGEPLFQRNSGYNEVYRTTDPQTIMEIKKQVDSYITDRKNRKVIKGY